MQQKINSPVASGAQVRNRRGLSFEDKYVFLQQENQRLKQRFRKICDALSFWKWSALGLKEQLQEQAQEET